MTPQHRQQLEELAKWHEAEAAECDREISKGIGVVLTRDRHRNAAKLLREVVDAMLWEEIGKETE